MIDRRPPEALEDACLAYLFAFEALLIRDLWARLRKSPLPCYSMYGEVFFRSKRGRETR